MKNQCRQIVTNQDVIIKYLVSDLKKPMITVFLLTISCCRPMAVNVMNRLHLVKFHIINVAVSCYIIYDPSCLSELIRN